MLHKTPILKYTIRRGEWMKKLKIILIIVGLCFTINAPMAQENSNPEEVIDEVTPLRGPKKESENLVLTFGLFCIFAVGVVGLVVASKNKKVLSLHSSIKNDDGSYTVTIRGASLKKIKENKQDLHVIIRKGNCIFLKKPNFDQLTGPKDDDLFVVVVNESTKIDFLFQDELFVIDGEKLK